MGTSPESVLRLPGKVLRKGDMEGPLEYCSLGAGPAPLLGLSWDFVLALPLPYSASSSFLAASPLILPLIVMDFMLKKCQSSY